MQFARGEHSNLRVLQSLRMKNSLQPAPPTNQEEAKFERLREEYAQWKRSKQRRLLSPTGLSRSMPNLGVEFDPLDATLTPALKLAPLKGNEAPKRDLRQPLLAPLPLHPVPSATQLGADPSVRNALSDLAVTPSREAPLPVVVGAPEAPAAAPSAAVATDAADMAATELREPVVASSLGPDALSAEAGVEEEEEDGLIPFASIEDMLRLFPANIRELWKLSRLYNELRDELGVVGGMPRLQPAPRATRWLTSPSALVGCGSTSGD